METAKTNKHTHEIKITRHFMRKRKLENLVITGKLKGKRDTGRPGEKKNINDLTKLNR